MELVYGSIRFTAMDEGGNYQRVTVKGSAGFYVVFVTLIHSNDSISDKDHNKIARVEY